MDLFTLIDSAPDVIVSDAFVITNNKIKSYEIIVCSISGGADSDIVLDICSKLDPDKKIIYVWFNTGLEYQATKDHLKFLEDKYGIKIIEIKAEKPIPTTCRQYGQPFLSKSVSRRIRDLQKNNFQWEDKPLDYLLDKYCTVFPEEHAKKNPKQYFYYNGKYYRGCVLALRWWCNDFPKKENGSESQFNIAYNKWLKEYMIAYPPDFLISHICCEYAKKMPIHKFNAKNKTDLSMYGVRKAEGGTRATAYKNCFTSYENSADEYRPIFFFTNETKRKYEEAYNVTHSLCYSEYGLTRTGCAGCPFGSDFEFELKVIEEHEPKLFKAVNNIFGKSYEYTRGYYSFREKQEDKQ